MVKQIKTKAEDILVVEVPKSTLDIHINYNNGSFSINNTVIAKFGLGDSLIILGRLSELSDEQCKELVETFNNPCTRYHGKFYDYSQKYRTHTISDDLVDTAKESFITLLQSEGIDINNKNELLIIKIL